MVRRLNEHGQVINGKGQIVSTLETPDTNTLDQETKPQRQQNHTDLIEERKPSFETNPPIHLPLKKRADT